jgi:hypothetical protein
MACMFCGSEADRKWISDFIEKLKRATKTSSHHNAAGKTLHTVPPP